MMSGGETARQPSGWTVDTLRQFMDDRDRRYDQRFLAYKDWFAIALASHKELFDAALRDQQTAVSAALAASDRAVAKAEASTDKRFEAVNEFRAQLADQAARLMPRTESEALLRTLGEKLSDQITDSRDAHDRIREDHHRDLLGLRAETDGRLGGLASARDLSTGRDHGISVVIAAVFGVGGLLFGAVGIVLHFVK